MTVQLGDRELDRIMAAWMDEGPTVVAETVIDAALARIPTVRQRGQSLRGLAFPARRGTSILRYATIVVSVILLITAAAAVAVILSPNPRPQPPVPTAVPSSASSLTPSADASPSEPPSAASGLTRISITGAAEMDGEWHFFPAHPFKEFPDLTRYTFFQYTGSACGCPAGAYLYLFLDPDASHPDVVRTSDRFAIRLGFPSSGGMRPDEYQNSHLSVMGECEVAFSEFSETLIEATFACTDVPSEVNDLLISATGDFSFDPREHEPAPME